MKYRANYSKMKQILSRKEQRLRRLVERGASGDKLIATAEDVRDARIRALNENRATVAPKDDANEHYAKIDAKIRKLQDTSPEEILAEFRLGSARK